MANFPTHIAVGTVVSGALATVTMAADLVAPENIVAVTLAGVLGSVLPDIDLKDSRPARAMFAGLGVFFSFSGSFSTVSASIVMPSAFIPSMYFTQYSAYASKYSGFRTPPRATPEVFIHSGADHGEDVVGPVRVEGGGERVARQPLVGRRHHEHVDVHDGRSGAHRGVGAVRGRQPPARGAAAAPLRRGVACGHEGREVAVRAALDERATGLGRQAREVGEPAQRLVLGEHGPGEITSRPTPPATRSRNSTRSLSTSAPSSPKYCTRL